MADLNPVGPIYTAIVDDMMLVVAPVMAMAIAIAALRTWLVRLKGAHGEAKVGRVLDQLFSEVLHDIIIPDGRGGLTQIDHIALTSDGLLAVETKNYRGAILDRDREAQWTQRIRGRSYRFQNPLRQNYLHVSALQALQLGVPVRGHVVFTDRASFPKGIPQGVSQLRTFRKDLAGLVADTETSPAVVAAWGRLQRSVRTDKAARRDHLSALREKHGHSRRPRIVGALFALAAMLLLIVGSQRDPAHDVRQPVTRRDPPTSAAIPAPRAQQRRLPAAKPASRPLRPDSGQIAEIQWSGETTPKSEECNLARVAVLVDNSSENRRRRERACSAQ